LKAQAMLFYIKKKRPMDKLGFQQAIDVLTERDEVGDADLRADMQLLLESINNFDHNRDVAKKTIQELMSKYNMSNFKEEFRNFIYNVQATFVVPFLEQLERDYLSGKYVPCNEHEITHIDATELRSSFEGDEDEWQAIWKQSSHETVSKFLDNPKKKVSRKPDAKPKATPKSKSKKIVEEENVPDQRNEEDKQPDQSNEQIDDPPPKRRLSTAGEVRTNAKSAKNSEPKATKATSKKRNKKKESDSENEEEINEQNNNDNKSDKKKQKGALERKPSATQRKWEDDTEEIDAEESMSDDNEGKGSKKKEKASKASRDQPADGRRRRRKFTDEEVENLFRGVVKFGYGSWQSIHRYFDFGDRTSVDLKDKWRNLEKNESECLRRIQETREREKKRKLDSGVPPKSTPKKHKS